MNLRKKTLVFSSICLLGVSAFLINEKFIFNKTSKLINKKSVATIDESCVKSDIESALENKSEEECTKVIEAVVSNLEAGAYEVVEEPANESEEEPKKEEYIVNGINYMDYIDYGKYANLGIVKIDETSENKNLNIRSDAGESNSVVGKITNNSGCTVISSKAAADGSTWYEIESGEVKGYVRGDFLTIGDEAQKLIPSVGKLVIIANCNGLNVRKEPSLDSSVQVLASISEGEKVDVISIMDDWIEVSYDTSGGGQDSSAYVYKNLVTVSFEIQTAFKIKSYNKIDANSPIRQQLVAYAQNFIGNPYKWGGTSLTAGCDCSGFTKSIFAKYGYELPRKSSDQASQGKSVSLKDINPGDLVFYGSPISHVAIYIGDGLIVHAANKNSGIKISNLYYTTPTKAVSILD